MGWSTRNYASYGTFLVGQHESMNLAGTVYSVPACMCYAYAMKVVLVQDTTCWCITNHVV